MSNILQENELGFALVFFCTMYYSIFTIKPRFLFTPHGTFREFGAGYMKKTILPAWLFTILLAVFSYLSVHFISIYPRII